jgi:putative transposase
MLDCSRETRRAMIAQLQGERSQFGMVPDERVAAVATSFGRSSRTIRRWLAAGVPDGGSRQPYEPSEREMELYIDLHGSPARVVARMAREGNAQRSVWTLYRAFERVFTPGQRALVQVGDKGLRALSLYLRWEVEYRNQAWQADHKEMPVRTLLMNGMKPVRPWWTVFIDVYSRAVMGWVISVDHNRADVLAALRQAITVNDDRGPFGGKPDVIVWDNGAEFLSDDVTAACHRLRITPDPTSAWSPWLKGKVERINRTFEEECLAEMPAFLHGPVGARGRLLNRPGDAAIPSLGDGPRLDRLCEDAVPIRLLVQRVSEWVDWYNNDRPHSALDGQTPRQRWESDATPVELVPPELLRAFLLAREPRKVLKEGVPWAGRKYWHEDLLGHVGEEVVVAHVPHEERWIEVYTRDGDFICTAEPGRTLSPEEAKEFVKRRRAIDREVRKQQAASRKRHRDRLSAMTRDDPETAVTNPATPEDARRQSRLLSTDRGAPITSDDMLGLDRFAGDDLGGPVQPIGSDSQDSQDEAAQMGRELMEDDRE